jgi:hypothetical protein
VQREHIVEALLADARRWREEADASSPPHEAESRRRAAAYAEESAARIACATGPAAQSVRAA